MKLTFRVGGRQPWQSDSDKEAARTTCLQRDHVENERNSADDPIADWGIYATFCQLRNSYYGE